MEQVEDVFDGIKYYQQFTIRSLPAKKKQVDDLLMIAELFKTEPENAMRIVLMDHDDPQEIYLAWQDEGYKMVLLLPMEDFGWPNPLLLCGKGLDLGDVEEILCGVCLEGKETSSLSAINHFRDISSEVYGEFTPALSPDERNREFAKVLDEMLHAFREDMTLRTYNQILSHIFEGIAYNRELPVLLDIDVEKRHTGPLFLEADDGTESLAVLTDTEGLERHTFLWVKIRELIRECEDNEKCDGFVFNHNREDLFSLPLTLLQAAIHAGHQVAVDEIRKETERIAEERGAVRPRA